MRDAENLVNSLLGEAIDIPGYGVRVTVIDD